MRRILLGSPQRSHWTSVLIDWRRTPALRVSRRWPPTAPGGRRRAVGIDVRVAAQLGLFTGYQLAAGGGERQVEEHLVDVNFSGPGPPCRSGWRASQVFHQGQVHPVVNRCPAARPSSRGAVADRAGIAVADGRKGLKGHLLVAVVARR